ncbi:MAG TPA: LuxR C-terminal-related transcriptional regulator [Enhygromyxa sp.]|nr:LuxR C-terminal-related transcriptional regulator [Enhygromyxa sp.]
MPTLLRHAIVLLITDDRDCGIATEIALSAMGCIAHRAEPHTRIDDGFRYDAAVLIARRNAGWCTTLLGDLQSIELACASLVVLDIGGPEAIVEVLRRGAVDCLVQPVSEPELVESVSTVIEATRRWRARFSRARLTATAEPRAPTRVAATARVFEPSEPPGSAASTDEACSNDDAKIGAVVERVGQQSGLTPREREVLYWLLLGHRYVDIASVLGVAPRTAKFHAANLLHKLELDSRYDLSRLLAEEL